MIYTSEDAIEGCPQGAFPGRYGLTGGVAWRASPCGDSSDIRFDGGVAEATFIPPYASGAYGSEGEPRATAVGPSGCGDPSLKLPTGKVSGQYRTDHGTNGPMGLTLLAEDARLCVALCGTHDYSSEGCF